VSDSGNVWLGVIAVATLVIAIVQVGVLVVAGLLARRLSQLAATVERDLKPIVGHVNAIGQDIARASAIATLQVERADRFFADLNGRLEQSIESVRETVTRRARDGAAFLNAVQAAVSAIRNPPAPRRRSRGDDEDALFI
jgi:hypothetical protein